MAQHLPIQVQHHCLNATQHKSTSAGFSPGAASNDARRNRSRLPGGTVPFARRPICTQSLCSRRYSLVGYLFVARRRSHTDPLLWCVPLGRPHSAARRTRDSVPPKVRLSPGAHTRATRRHVNSRTLLVFNTSISLIRSITQFQAPK